jgi:threonine-phosphate decarboxylase
LGFSHRLAREEVKNLEPCVHGGEVWKVINITGLRREEIIDFSANLNPLGPPKTAIESIKRHLDQIFIYPDSNSTALRERIVQNFEGISEDNVVVGNGSTELIHLFTEVFIEKGDVAVIPAPTFGEYENAVRKRGGIPKHIRLGKDFHVEPATFSREIKGAKVVFLCNPNNPTSILMPRESILEIVEKAFQEEILVFLDEAFIEFVDKGKGFSLISEVKNYPNFFVLRSFTKIFGLTGLRVGYGAAHYEIINFLFKAKLSWNVNCIAQVAAIAALNAKEYLNKTYELIKSERVFISQKLKQIKGFKVFPADANYVFIDIRRSGFTAPQLKEQMLFYGIIIRDCSSFIGLDEYYIRVAIKTRRENERLIEALNKVVEPRNVVS